MTANGLRAATRSPEVFASPAVYLGWIIRYQTTAPGESYVLRSLRVSVTAGSTALLDRPPQPLRDRPAPDRKLRPSGENVSASDKLALLLLGGRCCG